MTFVTLGKNVIGRFINVGKMTGACPKIIEVTKLTKTLYNTAS